MGWITDSSKSCMGIKSPSQVFHQETKHIARSFASGFEAAEKEIAQRNPVKPQYGQQYFVLHGRNYDSLSGQIVRTTWEHSPMDGLNYGFLKIHFSHESCLHEKLNRIRRFREEGR